MSDKLQIHQKAKPITQYPIVMVGFGGILGWVAHELYVVYQLSQIFAP